ncbi:MAG TPA: ATPase, T2SS/T4P/T4SS family [Acidimicrobiales bacterium]|nr:ATPase, T2SS/T4P/T4SS family [Acidimicrobiales bacterium]
MTLSPLQEVERAVQDRAKAVSLDMESPEGAVRLRALIEEEVARWSDDYKRGLRSFDISDPATVAERAFRNVAGYGPLEPLLADDNVWEIMINGPDAIFVKRHSGASGYHDEVFHDDDHVVRTLTKILDDASGSHRKLDPAEGLQDAQLDTGARLHIVHGDVGRDGHLLVNIRKFTGVAYRSLDELVEQDMLDEQVAGFLRACVRARLSIVVAGAPGAGKTTLLSCLAAELDPSLRVVIAEEVFEADVPLANVGEGLCTETSHRAAAHVAPTSPRRPGRVSPISLGSVLSTGRDRQTQPASPGPPARTSAALRLGRRCPDSGNCEPGRASVLRR